MEIYPEMAEMVRRSTLHASESWQAMQLQDLSVVEARSSAPKSASTGFRALSCPAPVVDPHSRTGISLDVLSLVFLAYDMVVLPFALAWDLPLIEGPLAYGTWATILFWSLDFWLGFLMGFFRHGELIANPWEIRSLTQIVSGSTLC